ncbi:MAG: peptidylprolyl isomerase [Flavobacteriaceae bacterium]|nr:peptidylprolyl isomerase [Flavobacteriaceae bacterium]|tara:strand:- start:80991 stop:82622 length:1632 start_codon:yes stop_codon:yes gene_type:complete
MKKLIVFVGVLFSIQITFGQKKDKVLATVNKEAITVSEFKNIYERNLDAIDNEEGRDVTKNLDLFINYKLKVAEAYRLKLDTLPSYIKEIEGYKKQLAIPYLQDSSRTAELLKDAYYRTKYEVKAKHILIRLSENATPKDTLKAYQKISAIRDRILGGEDFERVAVETSEDPSAKGDLKKGIQPNRGNLGYFSAFRMVYPFEDAAYNTKVGQVSEPFRTRFGYHIVKVDTLRESRGELEVAHILIKGNTAESKKKIDMVYGKLEQNQRFKHMAQEYSEDTSTKMKGGLLRRFGSGMMVKPFEDAAFAIEKEGEYSKPFQTRYGWHIVQLKKKHPIKSFDELKVDLKTKLMRSPIAKLSEKAVIEKLKNKYTITESPSLKSILDAGNANNVSKYQLDQELFRINDRSIQVKTFVTYAKRFSNRFLLDLYQNFKDQEVINYYKENLEKSEPAYASTLREYKDGLLLFELMQQKVWDKSSKDTLGLKSFYDKNLVKYKSKPLNSIKGKVMNDYQNYLDSVWIADLRKKSTITIDKKQLKKLIKSYK